MGAISKASAFWRRRSLRFWLLSGVLMTFCPVFISAIVGYFFSHQAVIQPLIEVSSKQRDILQPLQNVQLSLWDVSKSMNDFVLEDDSRYAADYRQQAAEIEAAFANLVTAIKNHELFSTDVKQAREVWQQVRNISSAILSERPLNVLPFVGKEIEAFEANVDRLGHRLATVYDDVRIETEKTHQQALADLVLWVRLVVAGFVISVFGAILGVVVINRSLVSSMDRLAAGAMRLAAGDREHRIEVEIPSELANVADAFNLMTNKIREQEKALAHAAMVDGLTGLYNRREFDRKLVEEIRRSERYGKPVSLIMGDIDHFKNFNDTHGHQAGDEALRSVAQTLKEGLRDFDKACRFGGEEFILILPECNAEAVRQVAERERAAVEARDIQFDVEQTAKVTISLGVATYPRDGATPETLLKSADMALYRAKESGRNRVVSAS